MSYIHSELNNGNIAAFAYFTSGLISTPKGENHGSHASVIVGREFLDVTSPLLQGRPPGCYMVVKNSWGSNWPTASAIDRYKKVVFDKGRPGHFLISEYELAKHLKRYTVVQRK